MELSFLTNLGFKPTLSIAVQFTWVVIAVILGLLLSRFNKKALKGFEEKWSILKRYSATVHLIFNFIFFSFLLFLGAILSFAYFKEATLLLTGFQLSFFIFLYLVLSRLTGAKVIPFIIAVSIFTIWGAHQIGQLQTLSSGINKLALDFGAFKLTPVTVIKALLLVVVLGWIVSYFLSWAHKTVKNQQSLRVGTQELLIKSIDVLAYCLALLIGLRILGINLTALTVVGGALGVGIGFGLQKITSNFFSGVILILEKSIEIDDLIELDESIYGFVRKLGARHTLIETFEGKEIMVPNEDFITSRVTNWTYTNKKGRISIPVGVSYHSDIKLAQKLILEAAVESPFCLSDPAPKCFLREFGDSSVNFLLLWFVEDVTKGRFEPQSEVMLAIWDKLKANNIEIPFPQRDVWIKNS